MYGKLDLTTSIHSCDRPPCPFAHLLRSETTSHRTTTLDGIEMIHQTLPQTLSRLSVVSTRHLDKPLWQCGWRCEVHIDSRPIDTFESFLSRSRSACLRFEFKMIIIVEIYSIRNRIRIYFAFGNQASCYFWASYLVPSSSQWWPSKQGEELEEALPSEPSRCIWKHINSEFKRILASVRKFKSKGNSSNSLQISGFLLEIRLKMLKRNLPADNREYKEVQVQRLIKSSNVRTANNDEWAQKTVFFALVIQSNFKAFARHF